MTSEFLFIAELNLKQRLLFAIVVGVAKVFVGKLCGFAAAWGAL